MDELFDQWAGIGLKPVTLPSGFQVRIRLPQPRDVIVRGILPTQLVTAVMAHQAKGTGFDNVTEEDPALAARMIDGIRTIAADSIRQARTSDDAEWAPITITPERFKLLPDDDQTALIELVEGHLEDATDESPEGQRAQREEAAATVDGYVEFRGKRRGAAPRKGGRAVRTVAEQPPSGAADGGAGDRPRARRAPRER